MTVVGPPTWSRWSPQRARSLRSAARMEAPRERIQRAVLSGLREGPRLHSLRAPRGGRGQCRRERAQRARVRSRLLHRRAAVAQRLQSVAGRLRRAALRQVVIAVAAPSLPLPAARRGAQSQGSAHRLHCAKLNQVGNSPSIAPAG